MRVVDMKKKFCPLIEKNCKEHGCSWYIQVKSKNAQSSFSCAITWLPILLIKEITEIRKTTAVIESFRNDILKGQDRLAKDKQDHNLLPFLDNDPHQAGARDPLKWPTRDYSIRSKKWNDDPTEIAAAKAAIKEARKKVQEDREKHTTKLIES